MKKLSTLITVFLLTLGSNAQNLTSFQRGEMQLGQQVRFNNFKQQAVIMSGNFASLKATPISTDGSEYLFDTWDNKTIITLNNKKYSFSNMNFNIEKEQFMSKIEGDSLFIFDFKKLDKVIVNGKEFKSIYSPEDNAEKVFQVIYENSDFSILKKYSIKFIESSPDPMLNRSRNKLVKLENYFLMKNGVFTPFKLKKKSVTNLIQKDIDQSSLDNYVKSNNLSYKNEQDLKKIFDFSYQAK
ncbi:hypothetical protein M0D21_08755 [Aquimarina sp. D1M17]|uniref:hypothetical protein n=1 Tax=Aquimarina acroporae TaxID=2937283 RepID=UPI0020C00530|nr:hypothetical protein [Aquimarina acroporae]MCK8521657.1 hypothetical protein [Aquimarina acroporae]